MIIGKSYVKKICKIGKGNACCRYLGGGKEGFVCLKRTEFKDTLDNRVTEKTIVAQGDNCEGFDYYH